MVIQAKPINKLSPIFFVKIKLKKSFLGNKSIINPGVIELVFI